MLKQPWKPYAYSDLPPCCLLWTFLEETHWHMLVGALTAAALLALGSHETRLEDSLFYPTLTQTPIYQALWVSSLILFIDDFLWGKNLDESTWPSPAHLLTGTVPLDFTSLVCLEALAYQCASSFHWGSACPCFSLWCSQRASLMSAPLSWASPYYTLCTHQWPKCMQWFQHKTSKWCTHL